MRGLLLAVVCLAGCYTGARATRDVNASWRGRTRAEIESRWGKPARAEGDALVWSFTTRHVELPSGEASLRVAPGEFDLHAEGRAGAVWDTRTDVVATVDGGGRIVSVEGPSLRWGPPRGINLRWGTIFGAHVGMGRVEDAGTPLPSGGAYIGGMLGPRLGLVGVYSLVFGGGLGMAGGIAAQWWPAARIWVRAGPAFSLWWEGYEDPTPAPALHTGVSLALIRLRVFVLDLRIDANATPDVVFGSVGIGVNVN